AVKVPGLVEPRVAVEVARVHDEALAFPVTAGVSHPEWNALVMRKAVGVDEPAVMPVLKKDREVGGRLEDLKGVRHVHDAWHAGEVALRGGIVVRAALIVLLLLRQRPRLVRNRAAFDDSEP